MSSPLPNYDAWLSTNRALEEAEDLEEAWLEYCEEEELDPEDETARERWLDSLERD